ncbi:MAG: shikimate kinase [Pseudobdellovibrionaceae bacterium]|jgi:shikimate kinase
MKWILIGHRGVGKSAVLSRLKTVFPQVSTFDLDHEVSQFMGKPISEVFRERGESAFREIEKKVFSDLLVHPRFIISVGGGFPVDLIPQELYRIWVKRKTDSNGRIFLDRPRLLPQNTPLDEFRIKYLEREPRFQRFSDEVYEMPEGIRGEDLEERKYFLREIDGGILTLGQEHLQRPQWLDVISKMNFERFELRDDLLKKDQIENLIQKLPKDRILLSYRDRSSLSSTRYFQEKWKVECDWALELGPCPFSDIQILSSHTSSEPLGLGAHYKWSPLILTWKDLKAGFDWQQKDPQRRSFLPRSQFGRWSWFRLMMKSKQKMNFVRWGVGSAADQPTLVEFLSVPEKFLKFAAVLGDPVFHSYSPQYHKSFFQEFQMPYFAIQVSREEVGAAIPVLKELGLTCASVTSPLKELIGPTVGMSDGSFNTLIFTKGQPLVTNTDAIGLRNWCQKVQAQNIVVWGGGGTLRPVMEVFPHAQQYSASRGEPRTSFAEVEPEILIWAGEPQAPMPLKTWGPQAIYDLNYREDSRAREYAAQLKCEYHSGLYLFEEQARAQQEFWRENL